MVYRWTIETLYGKVDPAVLESCLPLETARRLVTPYDAFVKYCNAMQIDQQSARARWGVLGMPINLTFRDLEREGRAVAKTIYHPGHKEDRVCWFRKFDGSARASAGLEATDLVGQIA